MWEDSIPSIFRKTDSLPSDKRSIQAQQFFHITKNWFFSPVWFVFKKLRVVNFSCTYLQTNSLTHVWVVLLIRSCQAIKWVKVVYRAVLWGDSLLPPTDSSISAPTKCYFQFPREEIWTSWFALITMNIICDLIDVMIYLNVYASH